MGRDQASVLPKSLVRVAIIQEILLDLLPGFDWVGDDKSVKEGINEDQLTLSPPLKNLAVSGRDAEPSFVVDRVFEASTEHGIASLPYGGLYHFTPLHPTMTQRYKSRCALSSKM